MLDTFTFTVVVAGLVFNVMNFLTLKKKGSRCDRECFFRYHPFLLLYWSGIIYTSSNNCNTNI